MEHRHPAARGALDYLPPWTTNKQQQHQQAHHKQHHHWDESHNNSSHHPELSAPIDPSSLPRHVTSSSRSSASARRNGRSRVRDPSRDARRSRHHSAQWSFTTSQSHEGLDSRAPPDSLPRLNAKANSLEIREDSLLVHKRYASPARGGRDSSRWSETIESLSFSRIFGAPPGCNCLPNNHQTSPSPGINRADSIDRSIKLVITDADNQHREGGSGSTRHSGYGSVNRSGSVRTSLTMSSDSPVPSPLGRLGSNGSSGHAVTEPETFVVPDLVSTRSRRQSFQRGDTSSTPCSTNRSSLLPPRPPDSRVSTIDDSIGPPNPSKERSRRANASSSSVAAVNNNSTHRRPSYTVESSPRMENLVKSSASGARAKHFTGPGFASLPPGLARSPTSRFINLSKGGVSESNSSVLNDSGLLTPGDARRHSQATTAGSYHARSQQYIDGGDVSQLTRLHHAPFRSSDPSSDEEHHTPQTTSKPHFARRALSIIGINPDKDSRTKRKSNSSELTVAPRTRDLSDHSLLAKFKSQLIDSPAGSAASMGNLQCCGARPEATARTMLKGTFLDTLNAGPETDVDRFDKAFDQEDIPAFVSLIPSTEPFEYDNSGPKLHPWAETPTTIGALSMIQLAVMASNESSPKKEEIRDAGAIPALIKELGSKEEDRSDAALIALSFLSVDFPKAGIDMFEAGIFDKLVPLLRRPKPDVRAAAAQTARNIYVLDVRFRRAFRNAGGCQPLVDLLSIPSSGSRSDTGLDSLLQLEAIYHIDDFIMANTEEVSDCVAAIKATNVAAKLEALSELKGDENEDLRDAAQHLYLRVAE